MKLFKTILIMSGISILLWSCTEREPASETRTEVSGFSNESDNALDIAMGPVLLKLLEVEKYGPFYSRSVVVRDASGNIKKEAVYCFTITKDNGWKVSVITMVDLNGDHKANAIVEDTDGDGKPDKGKTDERPHDGKFETEWTDQNGDGLVQPNELSPIDPPEEAPDMPNWF